MSPAADRVPAPPVGRCANLLTQRAMTGGTVKWWLVVHNAWTDTHDVVENFFSNARIILVSRHFRSSGDPVSGRTALRGGECRVQSKQLARKRATAIEAGPSIAQVISSQQIATLSGRYGHDLPRRPHAAERHEALRPGAR